MTSADRVIMPWQYMATGSLVRKILLEERPDIIEVTDKYTLSMIGPMIRTNKFRRLGRPMLVHFSCERMDDNVETFIPGGRFGKSFSRFLIRNYHLPAFDFHLANWTTRPESSYESVEPKGRFSKLVHESYLEFISCAQSVDRESNTRFLRGVNIQKFNEESRSAGTECVSFPLVPAFRMKRYFYFTRAGCRPKEYRPASGSNGDTV